MNSVRHFSYTATLVALHLQTLSITEGTGRSSFASRRHAWMLVCSEHTFFFLRVSDFSLQCVKLPLHL